MQIMSDGQPKKLFSNKCISSHLFSLPKIKVLLSQNNKVSKNVSKVIKCLKNLLFSCTF